MVMKIYTKTGDTGETGLIGGKRVSKDHVRVDAYGEVDELNSVVGLARAESEAGDTFDLALERIQCLLFELGSELATPQKDRQLSSGIQPEDTAWLESEMDKAEEELEPLKSFILPGARDSRPIYTWHVQCVGEPSDAVLSFGIKSQISKILHLSG